MSEALRVLHLSTLYPPHIVGGAERSVSMLAEAQASAGWKVAAACLSPDGYREEERNGVAVFRMPHSNDFWLEDWPRYSQRAREWAKFKQQANFAIERSFGEVLDRFRPQIVNTHSLVDVSTRVWRAAHTRGIPIVHTLRDFDLLCAASSMYRDTGPCRSRHLKCRVLTFAKGRDQRLVSAVTAVGSEVLERHLEHGFFRHVPQALRRVIWNTASVEGVGADYRRPERGGAMVFGFLGRISPEKGLAVLIEALRALPPHADYRLLVAGTAPEGLDAWRARAEGLPIEFLGFTRPKDLFEQIDLLVVPSVWAEPLGRTVIEAYRAGVPVIGSRTGGIAEVIADDDWLVAPGDITALSRRLALALAQGRSGAPAGRQRVADRTTPEAVAAGFAAMYEAVLQPRGRMVAAQ